MIRKKDQKRWDFPIDQDSSRGGWSKSEYYPKVQEALREGKIKLVAGDLTKDGLGLTKKIAQETGVPLRLIYVSNIFDYSANNQELFRQQLRKGVEEGWIDKQAQVVDAGGTIAKADSTKVFSIAEYIIGKV